MKNKPDPQNQDYQRLKKYQKIWQQKKILRVIYSDWYRKINQDLKPGKTLEIGSGTGNFKRFNSSIISSDIVPCEWLDKCIDAHSIPFPNNALSNIVMIDALHHLQNPIKFLNEANRALEKNGRLILNEPFPSSFSLLIYKIFHPEPFIFDIDIFSQNHSHRKKKKPWSANQAIPFLLFFKQINKFNSLFGKKFKIIKKEKFSFLLYLVSEGFERKQLIPDFLIPLLRIFEWLLYPLRGFLSFRCYIILKKIN